jgi:alanine racemase
MHDAHMALSPMVRPTRAEIDLGAVVHNIRLLGELVGPKTRVFAVIKADAYGHGAVPVARVLAHKSTASGLAVSLSEEGFELREAGIPGPILVLGGVFGGVHRDLLARGLTPVVSDPADLDLFARAAASLGIRAEVHLKIDTGMARLGARPADVAPLLARCSKEPNLLLAGLCTHLSSADSDPAVTREQLGRFDAAVKAAHVAGVATGLLHAGNTAGTVRFPEARYNAVRPGLAIFGAGAPELALRPVMSFSSAIVQLRDVEPGDGVSYGQLWRAPARARIATLPVGYADGYPRRLTGQAEVLVQGLRCPVVGAICMDMTMVDVTALGDRVKLGDPVVLLGQQGSDRVTVEELAAKAGVLSYEILCGISKRVPRVYVGT